MVTTKKKTCSNHTKKHDKSKHTHTKRHQNTRKESRIKSKKQWIYKTARKQWTKWWLISSYNSIIILNVMDIILQIKRHRMAESIKKQNPKLCYLQEIHFSLKDAHGVRMKWWWRDKEKASDNCNEEGEAALYLMKIYFQLKMIKRKSLYNDKGVNPLRKYNILSIYVLNTGAPKYVKQKLTEIKWEINSNKIIV